MNRSLKLALLSLALPLLAAGGAQAQSQLNCNPVVDATGDPVLSSGGDIVSNSFVTECPQVSAVEEVQEAPARSEYLVFFDWDEATLLPSADAILADAAEAVRNNQASRVRVAGFADTSGPADYNDGLSERRAQAIRERLASFGIPAEAIEVEAFGETNLRVPTPDGVREPQNRRTQIYLE